MTITIVKGIVAVDTSGGSGGGGAPSGPAGGDLGGTYPNPSVQNISFKVALNTQVSGNLPVGNLNGGVAASATSFWAGDGSWRVPAGGSGSGTVASAGASQIAYYASAGTTVYGTPNATITSAGGATFAAAVTANSLHVNTIISAGGNINAGGNIVAGAATVRVSGDSGAAFFGGIVNTSASYNIRGLQGIIYPGTDNTPGGTILIGASAGAGYLAVASANLQSTIIGYEAAGNGTITTAAVGNVAVGYQALASLTTGSSNVVVGAGAGGSAVGTALSTGIGNVLVGLNTGLNSGSNAGAVGIGRSTVPGASAVAIGDAAQATATNSISIGLNAKTNNTGTVVIGPSSGNASLGANSTGVGQTVLANATGTGETVFGDSAGKFIAAGNNNTAIGYLAMQGITGTKISGSDNTAVGKGAGFNLQGGASTNTIVGSSTGLAVTSGTSNTILGASVANTTLTTGSRNIYIGASNAIDATSSSVTDELKIGNSSTPVISATGINGVPVTTLGGANTLSGITTFGSGMVRKVRVVTAAGAVTVATTDHVIILNKTVGAATTFNLPGSPTTGTEFEFKDGKGDAATNNMTITPAAGNIDGAPNFVMNNNYQANKFIYNGTEWSVF